jgi:undecaprenyl-diphosphatase
MERMTTLEAIILGLIQGLTEFIPISSSGHLVIAQYFMSGASDHLFLEWINVGTVLALIIYFRQRIWLTVKDVVVGKDYRLATNVAIAMLPAGVVGFVLADFIETNPFFGSVWTVVVTLFVVGVLLVVLERLPKRSEIKDESELPKSRALTIGLAQVLALVPGTSRSGATIIAGRLMGLNAAKAAEFSFLVSIPIMLGVITKLLVKSSDRLYLFDNLSALSVGNLAALVSGLIAVGFLMRYLEKRSLAVFGYYRIGLAIVLAAFLLLQ